jgi:AAA15 family ATPase/GTPase
MAFESQYADNGSQITAHRSQLIDHSLQVAAQIWLIDHSAQITAYKSAQYLLITAYRSQLGS